MFDTKVRGLAVLTVIAAVLVLSQAAAAAPAACANRVNDTTWRAP